MYGAVAQPAPAAPRISPCKRAAGALCCVLAVLLASNVATDRRLAAHPLLAAARRVAPGAFAPPRLAGAAVPDAARGMFRTRAWGSRTVVHQGGEIGAAPLLLQMAAWVGLGGGDRDGGALERAAAAAACAVNFPAFGRTSGGRPPPRGALAFLAFFAEPVAGLDEMAAAEIARHPAPYAELRTAVRLLQQYEVMFWDAVYAA
eukprot:gene16681-38279_t